MKEKMALYWDKNRKIKLGGRRCLQRENDSFFVLFFLFLFFVVYLYAFVSGLSCARGVRGAVYYYYYFPDFHRFLPLVFMLLCFGGATHNCHFVFDVSFCACLKKKKKFTCCEPWREGSCFIVPFLLFFSLFLFWSLIIFNGGFVLTDCCYFFFPNCLQCLSDCYKS